MTALEKDAIDYSNIVYKQLCDMNPASVPERIRIYEHRAWESLRSNDLDDAFFCGTMAKSLREKMRRDLFEGRKHQETSDGDRG